MMDAYADALGLSEPKKAAPDVVDSTAIQNGTADPTGHADARFYKTDGSYRDPASLAAKLRPDAPTPKVDPYADALGLGGPQKAAQTVQATAPAPQGPSSTISSPEFDLTAHVGSSLAGSIAGGYSGIYQGLKTLIQTGDKDKALDAATNAVNNTRDTLTFQPRTQQGRQMIEGFGSNVNPLSWVPNATQYLGDKAGGALADAGAPGMGAVVNGAINAAPVALGLRRPISNLIKPTGTPPQIRIEPTMDGPKPAIGTPAEPTQVVPQAVPRQPLPAGAAVAAPASSMPVPNTPEAVQAVAEKAPAQLFPETPTVSPEGKFAPDQQLARAKILESVGIDPNKLRKSALSGDAIGGSTDFQTAKLDSPAGREMRSIIEGEKQALTNHADTLVKDTGGTHGVDQSALYARGNTILAPLDALKQWFDSKTSALYKAADERAQGVATPLDTFKSVLGDASELTNSDRVHLQSAVNAYLKKLGMSAEDGSVAGNAKQAETVRKYLNEQWSPQNSKLVGKLKDALDEDVTKAAGDDIYAEARRVRTLRGQTLDNPNGIAKLMDSSGPEGINRSVPVEKIADSLTGMPVDQFSHVVKTLKEAPPELQTQANQALGEIKAQFANKVQAIGSAQQGQWNAKGVTKYLQNNAARMAQVFTPEEIAAFRNLNDAGHIVAKDQSYPGAAVQGHNLVTQGVMHGLPTAGAAAGGAIAGAAGAAVGAAAGRMAAGAVDNAVGMRAVKKRTTRLADLPGVGQ